MWLYFLLLAFIKYSSTFLPRIKGVKLIKLINDEFTDLNSI